MFTSSRHEVSYVSTTSGRAFAGLWNKITAVCYTAVPVLHTRDTDTREPIGDYYHVNSTNTGETLRPPRERREGSII